MYFIPSHWTWGLGYIIGEQKGEEMGLVEQWPWSPVMGTLKPSYGWDDTSKIGYFSLGEEKEEWKARNSLSSVQCQLWGDRKDGREAPWALWKRQKYSRKCLCLKEANQPVKAHTTFLFAQNEDKKIPIHSKKIASKKNVCLYLHALDQSL